MTQALTITVTIPWCIQKPLMDAGVSDELIKSTFSYFIEEYVNDPYGATQEVFEEWLSQWDVFDPTGSNDPGIDFNAIYTQYKQYLDEGPEYDSAGFTKHDR
jgi:hypothetical protein